MERCCVLVEALACYSVADVRRSGECFCPELARDSFVQEHCANDVFLEYDSFVQQLRFVAECMRTFVDGVFRSGSRML